MKQFLEVGKLNNTHGIKGELKMQLWCDDIEFLKQFKTLYFDDKGQNSVEITSVRSQKNLAIIKLKGIDSIEQAEKVKFFIVTVTMLLLMKMLIILQTLSAVMLWI